MDIEFDLLSNFHINNWIKLSVAKRKKVLKQLEHAYAKQQGRKPCPITWFKPRDIFKYRFGYYSQGIIFLNKNLLKDENLYRLIFTTLHEGVHAWQDHVCKNPQSLPKDWDKEIIKNWKAYLKFEVDDIDYYLQPVEKHADVYAYSEIRKIYAKLSERGLDDPGFKEFIDVIKGIHTNNLEEAEAVYEENYRTHVQNKINYKYDLLLEVEKRYKFRILAQLLNDDIERYINDAYFYEEINFEGFKSYLANVLKRKCLSFKEYFYQKAQNLKIWQNIVDFDQSFRDLNGLLRSDNQDSIDDKKGEHPKIKEGRRNAKRIYEVEDALER